MRTCIFCGNRANTREHAWPDWVLENAKRAYTLGPLEGQAGDRTFVLPAETAVKVRAVCIACNNGWMSDLEREIRPLVGGLMTDLALWLNEGQQEQMARWVMKTVMVFEKTGTGRPPFYTLAERHALREHGTLPDWTKVWIGRFVGPMALWSDGTRLLDENLTPNGYVSTLTLGQLAVQVFTLRVAPEVPKTTRITFSMAPGNWSEATKPLWPTPIPCAWPPPSFLNGERGLEAFAKRFITRG